MINHQIIKEQAAVGRHGEDAGIVRVADGNIVLVGIDIVGNVRVRIPKRHGLQHPIVDD